MKKLSFIAIAFVLMLSLCACNNQDNPQSAVNVSNLELEIASLKEENKVLQESTVNVSNLELEIASLKEENKVLQDKIRDFEIKEEAKKASTTVQIGDVGVAITNKSTRDGEYGEQYIDFVFSVQNNTEKSIKGVQGVATFKDIFGVEILSMNCDFVGNKIASNETISVSGLCMDCNQFMDDHMELYNTNYEDIVFEYKVKSIVFSDGTTKNS